MGLRVLVDENASPRIVPFLVESGHEAIHVLDVLEESAPDGRIAEYARSNGYAILTHDDDFLDDQRFPTVEVLYYPDDSIDPTRLARRVTTLGELVDTNDDLARVTFLGDW